MSMPAFGPLAPSNGAFRLGQGGRNWITFGGMGSIRRAVIDVGTNSVKLLVAEVDGGRVQPVWEGSRQTRLGEGFYGTNRLQAGPVAKTAEAVADFVARARDYQAVSIRIIATSAAREAVNARDLTAAIEGACGLMVEIISGDLEADLAFQGAATDPRMGHGPVLLVDVGGGSTEFILGSGDRKHFRQSFPLGTVRSLEAMPHSDPPKAEELALCRSRLRGFMRETVGRELNRALQQEVASLAPGTAVVLVGSGGTASILGCMEAKLVAFDRSALEAVRLSPDRLRSQVDFLWGMDLAQRQRIVGLPSNRADVILSGAAIFEAVMGEFHFNELRITSRGLRFAAVMDQPKARFDSAAA